MTLLLFKPVFPASVNGFNLLLARNCHWQERRFWEAVDIDEFDCDEIVDCGGAIIAPGFIDIQINGAFGIDFSNTRVRSSHVREVARGLVQHGVTAFLPTVVTSAPATYRSVIPQLAPFCCSGGEGASNLGIHLEGPFIHPRKKGAHSEEFVHDRIAGMAALEDVYGPLDGVRVITLAPELPGALDVIEALAQRGVVVSMGHSTASVKDGDRGFVTGAKLITHLFNVRVV